VRHVGEQDRPVQQLQARLARLLVLALPTNCATSC
jgi:hypothetical protein